MNMESLDYVSMNTNKSTYYSAKPDCKHDHPELRDETTGAAGIYNESTDAYEGDPRTTISESEKWANDQGSGTTEVLAR